VGLMEKDNRKSHLAPQLSPATQELLRSTDSPTFFQHQATQQQQPHQLQLPHIEGLSLNPLETPTSGEIPIGGAGIISPRDHYDHGSYNNYSRTPSAAVHPASAGIGGFSLAGRGPATGGLPARNGTPDDGRGESRRQARFGMPPPNGGYNYGYPSN